MATQLNTIEIVLRSKTAEFRSKVNKATSDIAKFGKKNKEVAKKAVVGNKNIQRSFSNVAGSIAAVQGPLGPVAGRISAIGAIVGRVKLTTLGFTAAFVAAGLALTKIVKNTAAVERQMFKLEGILKATGNAAGLSLTEVEDLSREIGIATLASVAKVRDAAGILLTFKSIQGDVFKDALRLSQDLAEVGFGDLKTGATQLGKALEDPVVGLGALRRVGVSFTDDQKEVIKVLTMTGEKAEAQKIILKALNEQVGGAGVKAASGLAGAVDSLLENLDLFFEQTKLGRVLVNGLTGAINLLSKAFASADVEASRLKTLQAVNEQIKRYKKELDELVVLEDESFMDEGVLSGSQQRYNEILDLIKELKIQQANLAQQEERNLQRTKGKNKEEVNQEHQLATLRKDAIKNSEKTTNRTIQNLGKTAKQQALNNSVAKLTDDLFKKLGSTGPKAVKAVQDQLILAMPDLIAQNEELHKQIDLQERLDKVATTVGGTFANVGDKIADAMARGKLHTLDFTSILQEIVVELQKMIIKVMLLDDIQRKIEERIKGSNRGGGISLGGIVKSVAGIFTGGGNQGVAVGDAASGGTIQPKSPTLVGERGPELFVPGGAGTIKNNADTKGIMSGGSGVNITQNLNFAVGITNTVRAEVMNMLPAIQNSTISAVADAKQRGGKFSKAFGN